ncbi:MAG: lipid-A-disaccharide synthase [Desulfobacterales bacterium]|nr:lipid-A-disaccharide synthase [Desulfobacterales bacterium]MBF0396685.1 lipid-A-disaccharide synthase [Desulfobacterales bacterium]
MKNPFEQKCVMIIAGEASGDLHGSNLVYAMRRKCSSIFFCGIGGERLKDSGVRILFDAAKLSVVGITEVISKLPTILKGMNISKNTLKILKPDLLILIDFPDFNFVVASYAKKLNIPVLYYISPQVWAWRQGRVKKIRKLVDHLAVILPFEASFFKKHDVPVTFVGHPLLDHLSLEPIKKIPQIVSAIGLLPGSRNSEIKKLLPTMIETAEVLTKRIGNIKFILSVSPTVDRLYVEKIINTYQKESVIEISTDNVYEVFKRSIMVIAASGTVTLEAAIACIPTVIIYKVSSLSYFLGKALIKVNFIGLINLIAGEEIFPELLQKEATPENISEIVYKMISTPSTLNQIKDKLFNARKLLGEPGASNRTADIAINMLEGMKI